MNPLLVTFLFLAAFSDLAAVKVEVGGRVVDDLGGPQGVLVSATEVLSLCRPVVEDRTHESRVVLARPDVAGFFRLTLPHAAPWRITTSTQIQQREVVLEPWFGSARVPAKDFLDRSILTSRLAASGNPALAYAPDARESIDLRVIEEGTGEPIPGAVLWLETQPECYATSGEDGVFRLSLSPHHIGGELRFRVRAPFRAETSFSLEELNRNQIIALKQAPATLIGQALDRDGRPVREASVRIGHREAATYTDENGRFSLLGFPAGKLVHVEVTHQRFRPASRLLETRISDEPAPIPTLTMWHPRDVKGRIVDEKQRPLKAIEVEIGGTVAAITDEAGEFVVPSVADALTTLSFVHEGLVSSIMQIETGEGETPLDLGDIVLESGLRLWGRVTSSTDEAVRGAEITLGDRSRTIARTQTRVQVTFSGDNGEFTVDGLPVDEDIKVKVRARGYSPIHARLRLSGDEERTFVLQPAARLLGVVSDSQEIPLDDVLISIRTSGAAERSLNLRSDAKGQFIAEDLPPGPARLIARASGFAWHDEIVELREGEDVEIDVRLVPESMVVGHLTDDRGGALAGAVVRALRGPSRPAIGDTTDAAGNFLLLGLRPGALDLEVSSGTNRRRFKTVVSPGEQSLDLQFDDVATFSLKGQAILGQSPLAGVVVRLMETVNGKPMETVTGHDGGFQFEGLQPTEYSFSLRDERGFVLSAGSSPITLHGDVSGWILDARLPCSLSGRVAGLTPRELGETIVHLRRSSASIAAPVDRATGEFSASGLLPGSWTLEVSAIERPRRLTATIDCKGYGEALTAVLDFDHVSM